MNRDSNMNIIIIIVKDFKGVDEHVQPKSPPWKCVRDNVISTGHEPSSPVEEILRDRLLLGDHPLPQGEVLFVVHQ
ncbi:hypothetical protein ACLOJK_015681 [Asimina triloba]